MYNNGTRWIKRQGVGWQGLKGRGSVGNILMCLPRVLGVEHHVAKVAFVGAVRGKVLRLEVHLHGVPVLAGLHAHCTLVQSVASFEVFVAQLIQPCLQSL